MQNKAKVKIGKMNLNSCSGNDYEHSLQNNQYSIS
jgi:hypothetical protein